MFKKGQSGNSKGRPRTEDSAAFAIRKAITDGDWRAMAVSLRDVVMDSEQKGKDRAAAYNALADRAFGKPVQKQVVQQLPTPPVDDATIKEMQAALGLPELQTGIEQEDDSDVDMDTE